MPGPGDRRVDLSREHIDRQLARSIEQLGRVDLYLSHVPDPQTPLAETLEAFAAARDAGLIRAFGMSNVDAPLLEQLLLTADKTGLPRPEWIQNGLSLLNRGDEKDLLPLLTSVVVRTFAWIVILGRQGVLNSALIGLGLNEGAYLAEIIRSGVLAVPKGQFEAARAIGMTWPKTMRVVVMPQALRIIIPPLGNAFNGLMKTSSLASVISLEELLRRTELLVQVQFKVLEIFLVAAFYYLVLTTVWSVIQGWLEAYASRSVAEDRTTRRTKLTAAVESAVLSS